MTSATPKPLSLLLPNIVPERMYSLEGEKLRFFKTATGIDDEDKLREHISAGSVQGIEFRGRGRWQSFLAEVVAQVYGNPCIATLNFTKCDICGLWELTTGSCRPFLGYHSHTSQDTISSWS